MNVVTHPLQGIELFSGVGMLGEGLRAGLDYLGIPYRAICHVEREAHAASAMVARMEEGSMDAAPIWSDVTTFDARKWRGKVDCVVAGFPCQDLSVAGRRAGLDGERSGLFFEVVRIADDSGAWLMLLENVAGIASASASVMDPEEGELDERAASRVVGELADCGWNAEWITLSASDVGASHGRARWFCIAWRETADSGRMQPSQRHEQGRSGFAASPRNQSNDWATDSGIDVADSMCSERRPGSVGGTSCQQRHDGYRRQADCEPRVTDSALGNSDQQREQQSHDAYCSEPWERSRSGIGGTGGIVADASSPGLQGHKQSATYEQDGRTDGRSRNHADQLPNFIMMNFSHPDQLTPDGQTSSTPDQNSRRHLNPLFGAWLMGWPSTWVIAEPHDSSALATASWRYALRSQLSSLLEEQELKREAA